MGEDGDNYDDNGSMYVLYYLFLDRVGMASDQSHQRNRTDQQGTVGNNQQIVGRNQSQQEQDCGSGEGR